QSGFLQRGEMGLKLVPNGKIRFANGRGNIENLRAEGEGHFAELASKNFSFDDLKLALRAQGNLRLLHIFTPFLEDLGGTFSLTLSTGGAATAPQLIGSARVEEGFFKLKTFPHPLERLHLDAAFSLNRILLQNIRGQMAGGEIRGEGLIQLVGFGNYPTSVQLRAENVNLNFPDRVQTVGSGNLSFTGSWFPFLLKGTYNISRGLITTEVEDQGTAFGKTGSKSVFLPKALKEKTFEPIELDLNVDAGNGVIVRNSLMDGEVKGRLRVSGTPSSIGLRGKLNISPKSRLNFRDKVFEASNGDVVFDGSENINPSLYISATSRVENYDVHLLIQGTAKSPQIRLTSVPPLAEPDIISLLALGVTRSDLDQKISGRQQAERLGYEAAAAALNNLGVNREVENRLGWNMSITSRFDTTKNVSVPRVVFRKKLGNRWEATASRTVGADDTGTSVKLRYLFDADLSAVGSWENEEARSNSLSGRQVESKSILGLDLEFRREFK
ncbi:MAG: translocation/assembly module TamB, partial [Bdellovibrionaceae bacterium]|nr:translocation/assembly module TamB [Pseudobdellovibrionaceae bacterium]